MGGKVLFVALEGTPGLHVEQNFEAWADLPGRRAEYVFMGISPLILRDPKAVEKVVGGGGDVLLGLRPPSAKSSLRTESLGFMVTQQPDGPAVLVLKDPAWTCLLGVAEEGCQLAAKQLGKGRVLLLADASPLRNGSLHRGRDMELLTRLWRTDMPVIFDESHLGVEDTSGVGVLLRRYRLYPGIGILMLVALLVIWRNSVSLLPARETVTPAMTPQPAASL